MNKNALIVFFILFSFNQFLFADEITIVDVKRNIPLSDDETIYKDFYLNAGETSGLKKNLVVSIKRKIAIKDASAKSVGQIETVVGQLRIIHVEGKVAIGREYKLTSRDEEAMLEQIGIMSGDTIDLTGSFIDSSKPTLKKKVAENEPIVSSESNREPAANQPVVPGTQPILQPAAPSAITPNVNTPKQISATPEI